MVFIRTYRKCAYLIGLYYIYLLDLICQHLIQHIQRKCIADNYLVKIGEKLCRGKSTMT